MRVVYLDDIGIHCDCGYMFPASCDNHTISTLNGQEIDTYTCPKCNVESGVVLPKNEFMCYKESEERI